MVEAELFDKLCEIGCKMRKKPAPFGGIQVREQSSSLAHDPSDHTRSS